MNIICRAFLITALGFVSQNASAFSLVPIEYNSYASAGDCTVDCSSPFKTVFGLNSSISSPYGIGSNQTILSKSPSVSSYAAAGLFKGNLNAKQFVSGGGGYARLVYDFEITGPETIPVPVSVKASATLKATGGTYFSYVSGIGAQSDAYFYLIQGHSQLIREHETASYGIGDSGGVKTSGFDVDGIYSLTTNTEYQVQMTVNSVATLSVFTGVTAINGLTTEATIDPTFTVDPAYSKDYAIIYSEGLDDNPVSPVPLPPSAPMFGASLVALGALSYGLKRKKVAAAT